MRSALWLRRGPRCCERRAECRTWQRTGPPPPGRGEEQRGPKRKSIRETKEESGKEGLPARAAPEFPNWRGRPLVTAAVGPQAEIQPQSGLVERDLPGLPSHREAAEEIGGLARVSRGRPGGAGSPGEGDVPPPWQSWLDGAGRSPVQNRVITRGPTLDTRPQVRN
ncbi:hypothetical protein NDU88_004067 [Pleurodeles waltl]|uniref:Uncharacterized protein n=1 Tax=Pleurodeles waltl TaxID=8319 RepID=A0AAV7PGE3_PLEWA|nr:hypothetical protein NDU88_004067 [Pleurodeles waltl]